MTIVPVSSEEDQILLADSMLTIVDSIMSYRRRYRYGIKIPEDAEIRTFGDLVIQMERLK